jgi:hypothetical protein
MAIGAWHDPVMECEIYAEQFKRLLAEACF